ncbi:MAG: hypothetical protein ACXVA9_07890 [Bdellovibrionales bacterium]
MLYQSLKVPENEISNEHGGAPYGSYKNGADISCAVNYGLYSCTLFVDSNGQVAH